MKKLFSYAACILFVHQASASKLTLNKFEQNLLKQHSDLYLRQKINEYNTQFEPKLANKVEQGGLRKNDNPDKIFINVINNATNNDEVPPTIPLMYCCILAVHGATGESKRKGKQLFQEILQKAERKEKDIYSFELVE